MTEVPENAPEQDKKNVAEVKLTNEGRELCFRKPWLEETIIKRKVNEGDWQIIATDVHLPYTDTEQFNEGTKLIYKIELKGKEEEAFSLQVML